MRWNHKLDQSDATPKYEQIVNFVAGAIERGQLKAGERIPSSAELAKKLGINNSTVVRAFRELEQQGLITSQVGKGSFVAGRNGHTVPVRESRQAQAPAATPEIQRSLGRMRLSYINGMNQLAAIPSPEGTLDIAGGVPSPDSVDKKWFAALVSKSLALDPMKVFGYAHLGLAELRAAIAKRLNSQGYSVSERNIIITSGSQEALTLVANWSREEGRTVFVETPSYIGIPLAFLNLGNRVEGLAQDQNGSILSGLSEVSRAPRSLVYVCPDFHNPTGRTMSANVRDELGRFAARNDNIVVVDDIFRDMRFKGKDIPSLYDSLPSGKRILVGSFSKSFIPGMRVGFLVVEQPMLDTFA
ncbi:MAG: PLP-dependent aminotransferase family protein, partial [Planctomycetes bacterium]|nr:PLP-dependent aminotransferase family protein [Planctomycetota bacterium]